MDTRYNINIPSVLDVSSIDFNALCAGAPSLSSDSPLGVMPAVNNSASDTSQTPVQSQVWKPDAAEIECYCLNRLAEIRKINECSHTAPAFSCVMAFMGFLSELAYGCENETGRYIKYCHKFMRRLWCVKKIENLTPANKRVSSNPAPNSMGEILYSCIRCGLVHNMNVAGKYSGQDQVRIFLTHTHLVGLDCSMVEFCDDENPITIVGENQKVQLVFNAFDLCDAAQQSIVRMFQDKDVRENAVRVMTDYPVIQKVL